MQPDAAGSSFNHNGFYSMVGRSSNFGASDAFGAVRTGTGAMPHTSNYKDDPPKPKYLLPMANAVLGVAGNYPAPNPAVAAAPRGARCGGWVSPGSTKEVKDLTKGPRAQ